MEIDLSVLLRIIALGILIGFSAFFSSSETALFSLSKTQLQKFKETKTKRSQKILQLLAQPKRLLITILLGNEIVNISISAISTSLVIFFFVDQLHWMDPKWLNILFIVPFILLFGEVIPKTIAIQNNERFSVLICSLLVSFQNLVAPLVWVIFKLTDVVVFLIVGERTRKEHPIMEEEFITLVEESSDAGILGENEKELIYRVFDLGNMPVSKIMAPRGSIFSLPREMPLQDMITEVSKNHRPAVPIYEKFRDRIIGILYAKTLLYLTPEEIEKGQDTLQRILVPPIFIPETKQVYDLFHEFQFKKNQIAIVLDEFGGVIGLVAIGDILEELFGRLEGRHTYEALYQKQSPNSWLVDGIMPLEEFTAVVKTPLNHEEFETLGGFVFDLFGKLPEVGESIVHEQMKFSIQEVDVTKILKIQVTKLTRREKQALQ